MWMCVFVEIEWPQTIELIVYMAKWNVYDQLTYNKLKNEEVKR